MIVKHPIMIIYWHEYFINYRYVGDVSGITSIKRARTWVNIVSPASCYLRSTNAQFGTPYPRSVGFDTDIGAFIESSSVLTIEGSKSDYLFQVREEWTLCHGVF